MSRSDSYLDPKLLSQLANLELVARCVVEGFFAGLHASPFRGLSTEYSNHRDYTIGDETRFVDWKVYGRTDRLYIKQFYRESNTPVYLMLDSSASMGLAAAGEISKLQYGSYLGAAFSHLALKQADCVGLILFDHTIRSYLAPATKRSHLFSLLSLLERNEPEGVTDLRSVMHSASQLMHQRGVVILISDLIEDDSAVMHALARLKHQGHDVLVLHVLDARERLLDFNGPVVLEDLESDVRMEVDAPTVAGAYRTRVQAYLHHIKQAALGLRADYVLCDTSNPLDRVMAAVMNQRRRRL